MEPVYIPELSIAGARTTEMTKSYSACSQFGLAEDMRRELSLQPQTAARTLAGNRGMYCWSPEGADCACECMFSH